MRHIISWSGGKDSTCTVIMMHELINVGILQIPRSDIEVVTVEVMYCNKRGISAESRMHMDFIHKAKKFFEEEFGFRVTILHSDRDFLSCFNHVMTRAVKYPENIGKRYGFPLNKMCVIQRDCKLRPMNQYLEQIPGNYVQYLGICADEEKRAASMYKKPYTRSLLYERGVTEQMAREMCEKYGLLSPSYELSSRGGCWFCCNAKLAELANARLELGEEIFDEFIGLEKERDLAHSRWNVFKQPLADVSRQVQEYLQA